MRHNKQFYLDCAELLRKAKQHISSDGDFEKVRNGRLVSKGVCRAVSIAADGYLYKSREKCEDEIKLFIRKQLGGAVWFHHWVETKHPRTYYTMSNGDIQQARQLWVDHMIGLYEEAAHKAKP